MINVYTEEEAKEKVCPQAVHMLGMSPLINCMGGACMAWRWQQNLNEKWEELEPIVGSCGLAGAPIPR